MPSGPVASLIVTSLGSHGALLVAAALLLARSTSYEPPAPTITERSAGFDLHINPTGESYR
jgi:hypothetical protein